MEQLHFYTITNQFLDCYSFVHHIPSTLGFHFDPSTLIHFISVFHSLDMFEYFSMKSFLPWTPVSYLYSIHSYTYKLASSVEHRFVKPRYTFFGMHLCRFLCKHVFQKILTSWPLFDSVFFYKKKLESIFSMSDSATCSKSYQEFVKFGKFFTTRLVNNFIVKVPWIISRYFKF